MNYLKLGTELITSKSNSLIMKISKLSSKKYRNIDKLFICNGIKLFEEAEKFGADIRYLIVNDSSVFDDNLINKILKCKKNGTQILCVNENVFSKLSEENSPQGIIAVCAYFSTKHRFFTFVENDYSNESVMVFEAIRDPGNIGTIIRNSAAFGIDRLILSSDCADIYSPKVIRATMGAIFKVKIDIVDDMSSVVECLKKSGKRVVSTTLGKNSLVLGKNKISKKDAIIIGNEGHGISDKLIEASDETLFIPMESNTESLNASIAAAIIMWELTK